MLAFRCPLAPIDIPFVPFAVRERLDLQAKLAQQLSGVRPNSMQSIRDTIDMIHLKEAELTSVIAALYVLRAF